MARLEQLLVRCDGLFIDVLARRDKLAYLFDYHVVFKLRRFDPSNWLVFRYFILSLRDWALLSVYAYQLAKLLEVAW